MQSNNEKETWINEVMASANGMQRATPPDHLYSSVMTGISKPQVIKTKWSLRWAAAAVFLLALNMGSLIYSLSQNGKTMSRNATSQLPVELQFETTYNY